MELSQLETLIDETNVELLSGNTTPVHSMSPTEVEAFVKKLEVLYKNCIKIRLEKSLKPYKVGLDFSKYAEQEENRKKKTAEKKEKAETKKQSTPKKPKAPPLLQGMDIQSMIAQMTKNFCKVHNKMRAECGCALEESNAA